MCSRCRHERADLLDREVLCRPVHVVVERPLWRIRAGVADGADGGPGPAAHRAASAEAGCAMSYEPHPSTVAYRAIEILKKLPPGQTIATAPLAERLGTDTATVLTGLQTAVKPGLVIRERKLGLRTEEHTSELPSLM